MTDKQSAQRVLQQILERLEARKELAIAKVAPKLVGVKELREAEFAAV